MKRIWISFLVIALMTTNTYPAVAAERGSAEDAVALIGKVVAFYKKFGREKTIEMINAGNRVGNGRDMSFIDRDLYVNLGTVDPGPLLASGNNAKLVGKRMSGMKDIDGVPMEQKIADIANSKDGKGWVNYKWPDPITKKIESKSTYVVRFDDLVFTCGIYKQGF